jgi:O-antigen ligase
MRINRFLRSNGKPVLVTLALILVAWLTFRESMTVVFALAFLLGAGVIVYWPMIGVLLFAITIPIEALLTFDAFGSATFTRVLGTGVMAGWLGHKLLTGEPWTAVFRNKLLLPGTLFVGLACVSVLWAQDPSATLRAIRRLLQLFALLFLLVDVLDDWKKAEAFVRVLVIGALIAAFVTLHQYYVGGVRRAGGGVTGGVSATSVFLMTSLPFGFYMIRSSQHAVWRLLGALSILGSIGGIIVTFSRMGMILLPLLLMSQLWETLRYRQGSRWLAGAAVVALLSLTTIPWDQVADRAATIGTFVDRTVAGAGSAEAEGGTAAGRTYHALIGLAMFEDHPILGVGWGNYGHQFYQVYQFEVEGAETLYLGIRSPHGAFVGILADLGLVGTGLWLLLLGGGLLACFVAWRCMRLRAPGSDGFFLVQAVTYAYLLQAVAYTWSTPTYETKVFWIVLILTAVVEGLARRTATVAEPTVVQSLRRLDAAPSLHVPSYLESR